MSSTMSPRDASAGAARGRWWLIAVGALLLALGLLGLSLTLAFTIASTLWYGVLLLVAGLGEIAEAAARPGESEPWQARAIRIAAGILYLLGGLYAIVRPLDASLALTLVLGLVLVASGLVRIVWAVTHEVRGSRTGIILLAVLSGILGAAILAQWPWSGLWAIGLLVSCELIAAGLSWCWIGLARGRPAAAAMPARGSGLPAH
ncbi:HdeD family acid-resistance protein [Methylobacterium isbiliense]|uniref:HdeD family acid-resistance protein n=1 Tax=Methylobacterium isbiliense TaxID=315478 RepID=A0ABQ4SM25_9HYPH|nr:DUF308 domain-containing protein [Methylobacterium isbiliense]MDN3623898.1 DUF308 domain-containing protein [Methylobacterium isbiliense]GJE02751.1 hypothetical protein GMJLKIPL_4700 [Methylobacterium isbiliense]